MTLTKVDVGAAAHLLLQRRQATDPAFRPAVGPWLRDGSADGRTILGDVIGEARDRGGERGVDPRAEAIAVALAHEGMDPVEEAARVNDVRRGSAGARAFRLRGRRDLGDPARASRRDSPPRRCVGEGRRAIITRIEDWFAKGCGRCDRFATPDCATRRWAAGLAELRRACLGAGLAETVKWGQPCYRHAGRNIAIIGALRRDFRLGFFDAALLRAPCGLLERSGPGARAPDVIRFTDAAQVAALASTLAAYLGEAMGHAEAGRRPPRDRAEVEPPEELAGALAADPELAEAFGRLTPGRRRSYVVALSTAKTSATRTARVARFRDGILAGKGARER